MKVLAVLLVVLASFVEAERKCKCSSARHPQQLFCRSDFFFRGRLIAGPKDETLPEPKQPEGSFRIWATERRVLSYAFRVEEVLKGRGKSDLDDERTLKKDEGERSHSSLSVKIHTDPNTCTVNLSSKTTYAIGAYIDEGKLFISSCNFARPWRSLSKSQKLGFRRVYKRNCQCRSCSSLDPQGELLDRHCSQKHLFCGKKGLSCQWKYVTRNHVPYNRCVFMRLFGFYFRDFEASK